MAHLDKIEHEKKERKERKVRKEEDKESLMEKLLFEKVHESKKQRETKKSCERYFEIERKAGISKVIKRFKY